MPDIEKIMRYESGEMDDDEIVYFFSDLIKSGVINHLQGHYGRTAGNMIANGWIDLHGNVLIDI